MLFANLSEQFDHQFDLVLVSDSQLQDEVYKIRYQVYCEDLAYEKPENFPDRRESDTHDQSSIHCLLKHKETGLWAGCVRLVLAHNKVKNGQSFPFESHFGPFSELCQTYSNSTKPLILQNVGEVSRLAVLPQFRRRKSDTRTAHGVSSKTHSFSQKGKRQFPIIPTSLYLAATCVALSRGLDFVITVMEPRLARHLRYFGIHFDQIYDCIDFKGKRGLFIISRPKLLENLRPDCLELMTLIDKKICDDSTLNNREEFEENKKFSELSH